MSDCCNLKVEDNAKRHLKCKECGRSGKPVKRTTLEHLLIQEKITSIYDIQYFFCLTADCDVVYFSENVYFYKADLKVRIGLKETADPIPVCYCFDYTKKMILDDLIQNGHSTLKERITNEIKIGNCQCQIKNPEGACCLANIVKIIKDLVNNTEKDNNM